MSDNEMLYCLIAFILGWLVSRQMGNGFSVGADQQFAGVCCHSGKDIDCPPGAYCNTYTGCSERGVNSAGSCYYK